MMVMLMMILIFDDDVDYDYDVDDTDGDDVDDVDDGTAVDDDDYVDDYGVVYDCDDDDDDDDVDDYTDDVDDDVDDDLDDVFLIFILPYAPDIRVAPAHNTNCNPASYTTSNSSAHRAPGSSKYSLYVCGPQGIADLPCRAGLPQLATQWRSRSPFGRAYGSYSLSCLRSTRTCEASAKK